MTKVNLRKTAGVIAYEWAMLLGASDSNWHHLKVPAGPLAVVHAHARVELVWVHGRCLYDFLFKQKKNRKVDDLYVGAFLEGDAARKWNVEKEFHPHPLCTKVAGNIERANKKLFHPTERRFTDAWGLPGLDVVRKELSHAFRKCYEQMKGEKPDIFRDALEKEYSVATEIGLA
jgi:hypothetical protein